MRAILQVRGLKTKLKASLTLRGRNVGSLTRTVGNGKVILKIRLNRTGRARLRLRPGQLKVKVTGSGAGLQTTTLSATLKTKR